MTAGDDVQLVVFRIAGQHLALNIFQVERILRYEKPEPLPQAPDFLEGMLPYARGAVPIVDLRKRLGVPAPIRDDTRIVILEWDQGRVGIVVDAVLEVKRVTASQITPPPPIVRGLAAEFISGIVTLSGRAIVILAATKLLSSSERVALEALKMETS
jgi:purine-binding chemotaxis protein CheW